MTVSIDNERDTPRSPLRLAVLGACMLIVFAALLGLGTWQVARRAWKLDLIARVDARVHAPPIPAPGQAAWPTITAAQDEYRHVQAHGAFLNDAETLVQASTDDGPGFWVMTPLRTDAGFIVMVNRGFVPTDHRAASTRAAGEPTAPVTVIGLLRLTEPKGGFLHPNAPAEERWYSRDVAAMAAHHGLRDVAPYFVDADRTPNPGGLPIGGLTVIAFPNSHLVYAITWYSLALMLAGGAFYIGREEWRLRADGSG